jgi:hypothetical protein
LPQITRRSPLRQPTLVLTSRSSPDFALKQPAYSPRAFGIPRPRAGVALVVALAAAATTSSAVTEPTITMSRMLFIQLCLARSGCAPSVPQMRYPPSRVGEWQECLLPTIRRG